MAEATIKYDIKNMNFNTIIFDLNGTITNSVSSHPQHILFRNNYIEQKIKRRITKDLPHTTTKALGLFGLDVDAYYEYRNSHIDWNLFHSYSDTTIDVLTKFTEYNYNLVLYTDCYQQQIKSTLKILKAENFFTLIVSKEHGYKKPSSKAYRYIANKLNVEVNELLLIANDYTQDLKPLKDIGGNTIWIKSEQKLKDAQKIITNHCSTFTLLNAAKNLEYT